MILAFILSPLGRVLGLVLALLAAIGGIYWAGYSSASSKCNAAALEEEIRTLREDIRIARNAEARAAEESASLRDINQTREKTLDAYEQELAEERAAEPEVVVVPGKPATRSCSFILSPRDAERVLGQ
ncbi:hypothetical protein FHS85_002937 [Rhodoligotrophos appendicifer]|uniref:hypothetical protein n=1 Tax=Rhodoligotrophos appendicifer TaxID=987056 RepID=UPI001184EB09|nr:hypothetical protein [Rhodoligotrophos appendicifer]